jgi:hypothetical protein
VSRTTTLSERVVARTSGWLGRRIGRRGFLVRTAVVGSALAAHPLRYLLRPGTAYAAIGCGPAASCGSGWTVMCCSINHGQNTCPPGTIAAGWWKADGSPFCSGPRYYVDCNATCSCGCGSSGICARECQNCGCRCNTGSCDQRAVCCNQFRYGQCHQEVRCVGAVVCRVVSCTPPWHFDPSCAPVSATSNATALHDAPCLHGSQAAVFAFGAAPDRGEPPGVLNAPIVGMDATPTGRGYWLVASDGGIFTLGDAKFFGSMGGKRLNRPVVDLATTPDGRGYWLVASDGGIFTFGNAKFYGSMGGKPLNKPIVGMAATPDGRGYWLVASDGGIFTFGNAKFRGSQGGRRLNAPIVGMARTPTGNGYWLAGADGGVFTHGDARFFGSVGLGTTSGAVDVASRPAGDGYWIAANVPPD